MPASLYVDEATIAGGIDPPSDSPSEGALALYFSYHGLHSLEK